MNEIWKDVVGYEGFYQVSNLGNVRSVTRNVLAGRNKKSMRTYFGKEKIQRTEALGYKMVNICRDGVAKIRLVHVLVMDAFAGPCPKGLERNHKDGNKSNNCIDNLEYCTRSENISHMYRVLNVEPTWGAKHWNAKLTAKRVLKIREMYATGWYTYKFFCDLYKVDYETIGRVVRRESWKRL